MTRLTIFASATALALLAGCSTPMHRLPNGEVARASSDQSGAAAAVRTARGPGAVQAQAPNDDNGGDVPAAPGQPSPP